MMTPVPKMPTNSRAANTRAAVLRRVVSNELCSMKTEKQDRWSEIYMWSNSAE